VTAGVAWRPEPEVQFSLLYQPSWEQDYESHGIGAGTGFEWLDRRLEERLDVRVNFDQVGRAGEPQDTWRDLTTVTFAPSLGWVVDKWTVSSLRYELQAVAGFQASPYRFVRIEWNGLDSGVSVPERDPELRVRHALAARLRRALSTAWFASFGYRFYTDSWGMQSHTGQGGLERSLLRDRLLLGIDVRGYWQSSASFYAERYTGPTGFIPEFRSSDKQLAESWSVLGGLRAELGFDSVGFAEILRMVVRGDIHNQHFVDFAPLDERTALIVSLGVSAER
jgi:hypothetical protein